MNLNLSTAPSRTGTNIRTHRRTAWLIVMTAGAMMQVTGAMAQGSDPNVSLAAKIADGRWSSRHACPFSEWDRQDDGRTHGVDAKMAIDAGWSLSQAGSAVS